MVLLMSGYPWSGATSFMRAGTEVAMLASLILLGSQWPRGRSTFSVVWLVTIVSQVAKVS